MSIQVDHVTKRFGAFTVLNDVNLHVQEGELVALLGPSGCGKTTLLRILAGLERPDQGRIFLQGTEVTDQRISERRVGFVFQHYALFRHMTVADNIAFGLTVLPRAQRPSATRIQEKVRELLGLVQLQAMADRYPSQLSGGQRQRVALARALAVEPKLLLLDEPFGALDAKVRKELRRWLRRLHDELHITGILVTHDQEEALEVADEIVVINEGRIEQIGTPDDLYDRPANQFVMRFLGPVTELNNRLVRPHDLELRTSDPGQAMIGRISRIVRVGFEVRVDVTSDDQIVLVTLTRSEFNALDIGVGSTVWVRAVLGAPTVVVG